MRAIVVTAILWPVVRRRAGRAARGQRARRAAHARGRCALGLRSLALPPVHVQTFDACIVNVSFRLAPHWTRHYDCKSDNVAGHEAPTDVIWVNEINPDSLLFCRSD